MLAPTSSATLPAPAARLKAKYSSTFQLAKRYAGRIRTVSPPGSEQVNPFPAKSVNRRSWMGLHQRRSSACVTDARAAAPSASSHVNSRQWSLDAVTVDVSIFRVTFREVQRPALRFALDD